MRTPPSTFVASLCRQPLSQILSPTLSAAFVVNFVAPTTRSSQRLPRRSRMKAGKEALISPVSQRDSVIQPRVDRTGLPWVPPSEHPSTLKGLQHCSHFVGAQPASGHDQLFLHGVLESLSVATALESSGQHGRHIHVRNGKDRV